MLDLPAPTDALPDRADPLLPKDTPLLYPPAPPPEEKPLIWGTAPITGGGAATLIGAPGSNMTSFLSFEIAVWT